MTQREVFEFVIRKLEELEIPYMVCGSVAAMAYADARLTKDMDIVIALTPLKAPRFCDEFAKSGFYCPPQEVVLEEFQRRGQFNLLHEESGNKVDCMILKTDEYSVEEFKRRQRMPFTDAMDALLATPEDVIIKKLEFYKMGQAEKHLSDIRSMIQVSGPEIDFSYVEVWVKELRLQNEWNLVKPK